MKEIPYMNVSLETILDRLTTKGTSIRKAKIIIRQIDTLWYPLLYRSLSCQWPYYNKYQP